MKLKSVTVLGGKVTLSSEEGAPFHTLNEKKQKIKTP